MRYYFSLSLLSALAFVSVFITVDQARGQDAQEFAFQLRFRQELAAIRATQDARDDGIFGGYLMKTLKDEQFAPPLQLRICEKAVEYGSKHPDGYQYALDAVNKLNELQPQRKTDWLALEAEVNRLWLDTGGDDAPTSGHVIALYMRLAEAALKTSEYDKALEIYKTAGQVATKHKSDMGVEIEKRIRDLRIVMKRKDDVAQLEAKLAKQPGDKGTARELAELYVFAANEPAGAVKYLPIIGDPVFTKHVELAAADYKTLEEAQCVELANWYAGMGRDRKHSNREGMLLRAKMYMEQSLALHAARDDAFDARKSDLRAIDKDLSRFGIGMKRARRLVKKLRGDEGVVARDPKIDAAIEKAVAWLYQQQKKETHWDGQQGNHAGGYTSLVTYAMLMAEEDPRTNDKLRQAIQWVLNMNMSATYSVCFRTHMWEVLPDNERSERVIKQDVSKIARFMSSSGTIHYRLTATSTADMSTTLAGFLTLWLGDISGMPSPHTPWQKAVDQLSRAQTADGGWQYQPDPNRAITGGMTAAALTILLMAVDQEHLDSKNTVIAQNCIDKGMAWLDRHFDPKRNPNGGWKNYYLAAVQHVGLMSGRKKFNNLDWYESAAKHLVETQRDDGSWPSSSPDYTVMETAFAVIFLSRGGVEFDSVAPTDQPAAADAPADDETDEATKKKKPLPDLDAPAPAPGAQPGNAPAAKEEEDEGGFKSKKK